jgi:IS30 family transposase
MSKPTKTFKHLQEYERHIIEALWKKQTSMRGIAIILDRSPNTISRELKRREIYQAKKAQRHAFFKRYRSKQCCMKVAMNAFLNRFVREKLHDKWSPKQMSGYLKHQDISISSKAIYKFIGKRGMNHLLFWDAITTNEARRHIATIKYLMIVNTLKNGLILFLWVITRWISLFQRKVHGFCWL